MTDATDISCSKAQQSKFCGSTKMFMDEGFKRLAAISHPVHSQSLISSRVNLSKMNQISVFRRIKDATFFVDLPVCLSWSPFSPTKQRILSSVETNCQSISIFVYSFWVSKYTNVLNVNAIQIHEDTFLNQDLRQYEKFFTSYVLCKNLKSFHTRYVRFRISLSLWY